MDKRRPLKSRSNRVMQSIATRLVQSNITPNQISLASIAFAAIGFFSLTYWQASQQPFVQICLLIIALLSIQARLLCNLFDGMVAIEGQKQTANGELYNEAPDRLTDFLFFLGLGLGLSQNHTAFLGLLAALLAMTTAYVRLLGLSANTPAFFNGPMAKPHRMATLSLGIILTLIAFLFDYQDEILYGILLIIIIGSLITVINRLRLINHYLKNHTNT